VIARILTQLTAVLALTAAAAEPVISEFCASNQSGLQDENGDRPDWIEIHNPDNAPVNLDGWHLTDRADLKTKWRFPAAVIPANGYLIVFASSKNRAVAGQPLHTNFSLSADGEYLGLIKSDGATVVSEFFPEFPSQFPDLSYGTPANFAAVTLVSPSAAVRWIVPSSATVPSFNAWREPAFDDSGWFAASQGIGFDRDPSGVNYLPEIGAGGNPEAAMYGTRTSCYLRLPFSVSAPAEITKLTLRVKYDDGFAAYLNGQNLLSGGVHLKRNAPATLAWNSAASGQPADTAAIIYQDFDVTASLPLLTTGGNLLAFQALNRSTSSSDLLLRAELLAETATTGPSLAPGYFSTPTPGARNGGPAGMVIPQTVTFSQPAGPFSTNFTLTLSGNLGGQVIRYTTDGSVPTAASAAYASPVAVTTTTLVRARIFDSATGAAGFVAGRHFEKLDSSLTNYNATGQAFRSALPILILNNRGGGEIANDNLYDDIRLHVLDRSVTGYAGIATTPALSLPAAAKIRGSSSAGFPKKSYGIEFRDETGESRAFPLLGMPAGADWALIPSYNFDRAFMRNAWIYEMGRQTGRWSPRSRFVEVWFNQDGDTLEYADYRGVYLLCENVRQGSERVDITAIEPGDLTQPSLSGGYVFKVDRAESDEFSWQTANGLPNPSVGGVLTIHRPKLPDLPAQQSAYLVNYFQQFETTLFAEAAAGFTTRNYRNFIDSQSWVDHNLLNMFPMNVDALRLSAYFVKDRGRRIEGGPLWDFDRSANSTDGRDDLYYTWVGTGDATNYFTYAWWQQLFADPEFRQLYVDRWQTLRRGPLATANFQATLDGYLAEFRVADADNPATRDYAKWYGSPTANNLTTEVANLKSWLTNRATWIDGQLGTAPTLSPAAGPVTPGQSVTLTIPPGTAVYYTTDGSDPRAVGGGVSPAAVRFTGTALTLTGTTLVTARAFRSGSYATPATNWSGPVTALYLIDEPYAAADSLRVTAINYNPLGPEPAELAAIPDLASADFEWLELTNISAATINLDGVQLAKGAPVGAVTLPPYSLPPGGRVLLVKRLAAFTLRHGAAAASRVIAEWSGDQSLDNGGERIWLTDRAGGTIAYFTYDDDGAWPGRADGSGSVLEYTGPTQTTLDYQNPLFWRSSLRIHGTPGQAPGELPSGVVINEILAAPNAPEVAAIELFNSSSLPVDAGGWYLSNAVDPQTTGDYRKFMLPAGTIIPAGGYRVFTEVDFNPNGAWNPAAGSPSEAEFTLDGWRGGTLWLISGEGPGGPLRDFEDKLEYSPTLPGVAHGRWPDGTGKFTPLAAASLLDPASTAVPRPGLGAANSTPRLGQIQVSEIMYQPSGTFEYLEIVNTGTAAASLDQWTLRGDVDYYFGPATTLEAGEIAVLVAFDPLLDPAAAAAFRAAYGVGETVILLGPWAAPATLSNTAGTVRLNRRVPPPPEEPAFVGLMLEDEVRYQSSAPWPTGAAGTGAAIQRLGSHRWGNDPAAWTAAAPSPGWDAGGYPGWQRLTFPAASPVSGPAADPDNDQLPNLVEYMLGTDPWSGNPLATGLVPAAEGQPARLFIDYTRRLDRDDHVLSAQQSEPALDAWLPAANDGATGVFGVVESRRAWLPAGGPSGFLRLHAAPRS
jgi:hypothetical protein